VRAELTDQVEELRTNLVEAAVEHDEDLMGSTSRARRSPRTSCARAIRKATVAGALIPVLNGSAFKNKGVQQLLDAVIDFLPSPLDVPAIRGHDGRPGGRGLERHADDAEPFSALAFKIMNDPFVGKLTFFRVYSGTLSSGSYVQNSTKGKRERIGRILQMHANKREEIPEVRAGDIAAAIGLKDTTTGDTLCDPDKPIILESMTFPEPVISRRRSSRRPRPTRTRWARRSPPLRRGPDLPDAHRPGDGADDHRGDGRAPPGDHRGPHAPRVQGRRQRRPAAGGLPRDDPQGRSRRWRASSSARPVARVSTATWSSTWSRASRAPGSSSRTRSSAA
jgi:hypothetical protein